MKKLFDYLFCELEQYVKNTEKDKELLRYSISFKTIKEKNNFIVCMYNIFLSMNNHNFIVDKKDLCSQIYAQIFFEKNFNIEKSTNEYNLVNLETLFNIENKLTNLLNQKYQKYNFIFDKIEEINIHFAKCENKISFIFKFDSSMFLDNIQIPLILSYDDFVDFENYLEKIKNFITQDTILKNTLTEKHNITRKNIHFMEIFNYI